MAEAFGILAGGAILIGVGYAGFIAGRESAERRAFYTISNLRSEISKMTIAMRQQDEQLRRAREANRPAPVIEVPEWMR